MARAQLNHVPLPYTVVTVEEAAAIAGRLQHLAVKLSGTDATWTGAGKQVLPAAEYQAITAYLEGSRVPLDNAAQVSQVLMQLQARLAALPLIDLELAWLPSTAFLDEIMSWLANRGPGAGRVRIHQNPALLGGLILGYAGRVLDYSLTTRLDSYELELRRQS